MFYLADGCRAVSSSVNKNRVHHFSTSTISGRRKTYTYFGSSGSGSKKGGSGSKGHTQCPHCGYTMFHKDTSLGKSIISISIFQKSSQFWEMKMVDHLINSYKTQTALQKN